ncbi:ferritin-like domain-containing protein [Devosia neptuniae]|jgi:ferritin-like metal-binding protein YciE|uniref:Ferritin-like domain-containing protein n=1 Tax=Devosia neptuniae TaxID=191302 RepID=A0ABY6C8D5_9HYPH|nr:ferritin-like domain-containing protein [Devosia neptuniae]UXN68508.1 ferritin-like domain-containing protein [Devosia neptuniae]
MTDTRDIFITGLRNAHAMENQALAIMKPQAERIENYPEVARRLEEHIGETEGQIERLERILDTLGEKRSSLKDMALSVGGAMAAIGHSVAPDEIVKNSFANFAFENYEIAAYKSLLALAQQAGDAGSVQLLEANLAEEQAMAEWLDDNIEAVTLQYASLRESGEAAKR